MRCVCVIRVGTRTTARVNECIEVIQKKAKKGRKNWFFDKFDESIKKKNKSYMRMRIENVRTRTLNTTFNSSNAIRLISWRFMCNEQMFSVFESLTSFTVNAPFDATHLFRSRELCIRRHHYVSFSIALLLLDADSFTIQSIYNPWKYSHTALNWQNNGVECTVSNERTSTVIGICLKTNIVIEVKRGVQRPATQEKSTEKFIITIVADVHEHF